MAVIPIWNGDEQSDQEVEIYNSLNMIAQVVDKVVKKAYGIPAFIDWGMKQSCSITSNHYEIMVMLLLAYSIQFWSV